VEPQRSYLSPVTSPALQTAEDLLRFREPGKTAELVRGVLIVREPPSTGHGARSNQLAYRLTEFVERHGLGRVFAQDTGFKIARDPDTVRAPDVAFVARERLARIPEEGYAEFAPDWVAEILSPGDRPGEVLEKVGQWLDAGVRLVWVLDPVRWQARVYRADGTESIVGPEEQLDGENVIPGFRCPLRDILS
jgi:Uma2 family endonuclease